MHAVRSGHHLHPRQQPLLTVSRRAVCRSRGGRVRALPVRDLRAVGRHRLPPMSARNGGTARVHRVHDLPARNIRANIPLRQLRRRVLLPRGGGRMRRLSCGVLCAQRVAWVHPLISGYHHAVFQCVRFEFIVRFCVCHRDCRVRHA